MTRMIRIFATWSTSDDENDENLIFVNWSNHLVANPHDGSAGKQAVSNTAKDDGAMHYNFHVAFFVAHCIALHVMQ